MGRDDILSACYRTPLLAGTQRQQTPDSASYIPAAIHGGGVPAPETLGTQRPVAQHTSMSNSEATHSILEATF